MPRNARLSDIDVQGRYPAGSRILAWIFCDLSPSERARLASSVQKFCGTDVRLLIVDGRLITITVVKNGQEHVLNPTFIGTSSLPPGRMSLSCSQVNLMREDRVEVVSRASLSSEYRRSIRRWVGGDNELLILCEGS